MLFWPGPCRRDGCTDQVQKNLELLAGGPLTRDAFFAFLSLLAEHRKVLDLLLTVRWDPGAAGRGAGEPFQGDFARHTARVRELDEATIGGA